METVAMVEGRVNPALCKAAAGYARRMSRFFPCLDRRDIEQEAMKVCLEARVSGAGVGLYVRVAQQKVGPAVARWVSPVSLGSRRSEPFGGRASLLEDHRASGETPEALLAAAQLAARIETLKAAVARAEHAATRGLPLYVREMGAAAFEHRYRGMHADFAAKYDIEVTAVIRALGRYAEAAKRHPTVRKLRAELADAIAEVGS